jgi:hypothetical protein
MSTRTDRVQLEVTANANPARKQLALLDAEAQKLKKTMAENTIGTKAFVKANESLKTVKAEMERLQNSMNINVMTLKELNLKLASLKAAHKNIDPLTNAFKENAKAIKEVTARKKELETGMGAFGQSLAKVKDQLIGLGVVGAITLAFTTLTSYISKVIDGTAKLSDELTEIARTTGLSAAGVANLNKQLTELDTRTSSSDLRKIAAVGGQFGIASKDLVGFTAAVDKVNIVMGAEFGDVDNLTSKIAGLRNVLGGTDNISDDVLSLANAEAVLAQNGIATADVITNIASRIGGYGKNAGLSSGQVLGLAAATQELNMGAERGSTAIVKTLQKMLVNYEEFAVVAGEKTEVFKELLNKDLYGAFIKVLEGSQKLGTSSTAVAKMITELELSGAGAAEMFSKFGNNAALVNKKVALATESLKSHNTINEQFSLANNNAAGSIAKLEKAMNAWLMNNAFTRIIQDITLAFAKLVIGTDELKDSIDAANVATEKFQKLETNVSELVTAYETLSNKTNRSTTEQLELNKVIKEIASIMPGAVTEFDRYGNAIDINTNRIKGYVEAEKARLAIVNADAITKTLVEMARLRKELEAGGSRLSTIAKTGTYQIQMKGDFGNGQKYKNRDADEAEVRGAVNKYKELANVYNGYIVQYNLLTGKKIALFQSQEDKAKVVEAAKNFEASADEIAQKELTEKEKKAIAIAAAKEAKENAKRLAKEVADAEKEAQQSLRQWAEDYKNEAFKDLQDGHAAQHDELTEFYENKLITQTEYQNGSLVLEAYQLGETIKLHQQWGDDTLAMERRLAALRLKIKRKGIQDGIDLERKNKEDKIIGLEATMLNQEPDSQEEYNATVNWLSEKYKLEMDNKELTENEKFLIAVKYQNQIKQLDKEALDYKIQQTRTYADAALGVFGAIDNYKRIAENEELSRLEEGSARRQEILLEQAKRAKKIALAMATIDMFSAIAKANPNVPLMVMAGIQGGIQIASIAASPIPTAAKGIKRIPGPSHSQGGLNVVDNQTGQPVLNVEGNESIIPKATTSANSALIDNMLSNYGKPVTFDWLYKNNKGNISNPNSSKTLTKEITHSGNENNAELIALNKQILAALNKQSDKTIKLGLYDIKTKNKQIEILERNAGL